jgi:hypothetical protein
MAAQRTLTIRFISPRVVDVGDVGALRVGEACRRQQTDPKMRDRSYPQCDYRLFLLQCLYG